VEQRAALKQDRNDSRLAARTQEADAANSRATTAEANAATAAANAANAEANSAMDRQSADQARQDADAANVVAASSAERSAALEQEIVDLQARVTDRGLVLTLGDVLFATGKSDLRVGTSDNLGKLVTFLMKYPERNVLIEGHTDSVGNAEFNQGLSQRRADAVRSFLTSRGIAEARLRTSGKGEAEPLAANETASGRQQNRRVEVIIDNPATALR
jgi:outer membrane protein OmpA-like peptidoglycan-associated protein